MCITQNLKKLIPQNVCNNNQILEMGRFVLQNNRNLCNSILLKGKFSKDSNMKHEHSGKKKTQKQQVINTTTPQL